MALAARVAAASQPGIDAQIGDVEAPQLPVCAAVLGTYYGLPYTT